jgi:hypothetical protein
MSRRSSGKQGPATKGRQREILEGGGRHDDSVDAGTKIPKRGAVKEMGERERRTKLDGKKGRQSEYPVSRGGMNQESRQHNKP